jgi:hypothetical protein
VFTERLIGVEDFNDATGLTNAGDSSQGLEDFDRTVELDEATPGLIGATAGLQSMLRPDLMTFSGQLQTLAQTSLARTDSRITFELLEQTPVLLSFDFDLTPLPDPSSRLDFAIITLGPAPGEEGDPVFDRIFLQSNGPAADAMEFTLEAGSYGFSLDVFAHGPGGQTNDYDVSVQAIPLPPAVFAAAFTLAAAAGVAKLRRAARTRGERTG